MKKNVNFELSGNKIKGRVIAFIIALVIAIGGIGYGVYSLLKGSSVEEGVYNIQLDVDASYGLYADNVGLIYYVNDDSTTSADTKYKRVTNYFNAITKEIYSLIDNKISYKTSDGYYTTTNLYTLNENPGEKFVLDTRLYNILKDAYEKTITSDSFNMFSGLLENYWNFAIFNELEVNKQDVETFKNLSVEENYSLEFDENEKSVKFIINDIDLIRNNETIREYYTNEDGELQVLPILSLNTLMDSYYLEYLSKELWEEGFTQGVLFTNEGLYLSLGDVSMISGLYELFDYGDNEHGYKELGKYNPSSRIAFTSIKSFPVYNYEFDNTVRLYRLNGQVESYSVFYNPNTGFSNSMNIRNSVLFDEGENASIVEVMFANLSLIFSDYNTLTDNYRKQDYPFALIMNEEKIYTTEEFILSFIPYSSYEDYEIITK